MNSARFGDFMVRPSSSGGTAFAEHLRGKPGSYLIIMSRTSVPILSYVNVHVLNEKKNGCKLHCSLRSGVTGHENGFRWPLHLVISAVAVYGGLGVTLQTMGKRGPGDAEIGSVTLINGMSFDLRLDNIMSTNSQTPADIEMRRTRADIINRSINVLRFERYPCVDITNAGYAFVSSLPVGDASTPPPEWTRFISQSRVQKTTIAFFPYVDGNDGSVKGALRALIAHIKGLEGPAGQSSMILRGGDASTGKIDSDASTDTPASRVIHFRDRIDRPAVMRSAAINEAALVYYQGMGDPSLHDLDDCAGAIGHYRDDMLMRWPSGPSGSRRLFYSMSRNTGNPRTYTMSNPNLFVPDRVLERTKLRLDSIEDASKEVYVDAFSAGFRAGVVMASVHSFISEDSAEHIAADIACLPAGGDPIIYKGTDVAGASIARDISQTPESDVIDIDAGDDDTGSEEVAKGTELPISDDNGEKGATPIPKGRPVGHDRVSAALAASERPQAKKDYSGEEINRAAVALLRKNARELTSPPTVAPTKGPDTAKKDKSKKPGASTNDVADAPSTQVTQKDPAVHVAKKTGHPAIDKEDMGGPKSDDEDDEDEDEGSGSDTCNTGSDVDSSSSYSGVSSSDDSFGADDSSSDSDSDSDSSSSDSDDGRRGKGRRHRGPRKRKRRSSSYRGKYRRSESRRSRSRGHKQRHRRSEKGSLSSEDDTGSSDSDNGKRNSGGSASASSQRDKKKKKKKKTSRDKRGGKRPRSH